MPPKFLKQVLASAARRTTAAILAAAAGLIVFTWVILTILTADTRMDARWKFILLGILLAVLLISGLSALAILWQRMAKRKAAVPSVYSILLTAYLLPFLVWILLEGSLRTGFILPGPQAELHLHPWFFFWQLFVLLLTTAARKRSIQFSIQLRLIAAGALIGIGLGLAAAFLASLYASFNLQADFILPPLSPALQILLWIAALLLAPFLEEIFFRSILLENWQQRLGFWGANLVSAALFALVQMRPIVMLAAFVFSLGAGVTYRRLGLAAAITAHLVVNLILFLLSGQIIL